MSSQWHLLWLHGQIRGLPLPRILNEIVIFPRVCSGIPTSVRMAESLKYFSGNCANKFTSQTKSNPGIAYILHFYAKWFLENFSQNYSEKGTDKKAKRNKFHPSGANGYSIGVSHLAGYYGRCLLCGSIKYTTTTLFVCLGLVATLNLFDESTESNRIEKSSEENVLQKYM